MFKGTLNIESTATWRTWLCFTGKKKKEKKNLHTLQKLPSRADLNDKGVTA